MELTKQFDPVIFIPLVCDISKLANEVAKSFGIKKKIIFTC